ncbi:sugar-binding transcriptional regulator [Euzebya tangerina]|uniref:sugar-binding transcriptional regulator n=1 Tax=Euzebya tangerina TaxID=591198 RepID=UPI0013C3047C|nr:sugar-binding domain-containing protein [Euzebya tangerina]
MSPSREPTALARAAQRYYLDGLTQSEVAREMHTTRSNVSRMLQAARDQGIVHFRVRHPLGRHSALEAELGRLFPSLREVWVLSAEHQADGDSGIHPTEPIGQLAARWLETNLRNGTSVALSWGRTLRSTVRSVEIDGAMDVEVCMIGGDLQVDPEVSGHDVVRELAARVGGSYNYLHAPALCSSPEMVAELRRNPGIARELERAQVADVALVGIGAYGTGFSAQLVDSAYLTSGERNQLEALHPVGDIAARFFDENGQVLHGPLDDRVLALAPDEITQINTVVGVAAGHEKGAGVLGALRAGFLDVIICDQSAAAAAIRLHNRSAQADQDDQAEEVVA